MELCSHWTALAALVLTSCVKYHPQPLDPPRTEGEFRARTLAAAGVADRRLDLAALVRVALHYSADLELARARVRTAEAAIITARAKPNPSVAVGGGWTNSPESPLVFRFDPALTLETAGKRGYRTLEAQKLAEAARLEVEEAAWRVRARLRAAWVEYAAARAGAALGAAEREVRAESVEIMEKRLVAGDVSRPDVDLARAELVAAEVARKSAEGAVAVALAGLAAAAGVPEAALEGHEFAEMGEPPPEAKVPLGEVQKAGLLHRADVRRSLLEYAAAEAALQLEVARQYPDIQLSPGYGFDEGHHKFTIGPGFTIPMFHRNQGPIAEAEARRQEAAARFQAVQSQAIGEMEKALAQYRSAGAELAEARLQTGLAHGREQSIRRALAAGEEDRLTLTGARVQAVVADRAAAEAMRKLQSAAGALEDALQQPLEARMP